MSGRDTTHGGAAPRGRRRLAALPLILLALLVAAPGLAGCASGVIGGQRYVSAQADVDPYANLRRKAEELYQAGLAQERRGEWRKAAQSYEQARLWDPDNRTDIAEALAHARREVGGLAFAAPTPTATLQPVPPKGSGAAPPAPTSTAAAPTAGARGGGAARPAPTPTAAAAAGPPAGYRSFRSKSYPYTIDYPAGWTAKADATGKDQERVDIFFAPPDRVEAFVMVTAERLRGDITLDQFAELMARQLEEEEEVVIQDREARAIGGQPAYVLTYRLQSGGRLLAVRHAVFVSAGWGWSVLLAATPGTTPELLKTYGAMLDGFQLEIDNTRAH